MASSNEAEQTRRLLDVGRALVAEHSTEAVLDRILAEAREITGARYAALGVLDEQRLELERFITVGIDPAGHAAIGDLPRGRGVLGVLIEDPRPLRLNDVGDHPHSYGFPAGHPAMSSFLGVPITIRGEAWGNLYLTEKEGGEGFTEADEEAVLTLSQWAATAIDNARLYERSERRREELERAVRALEAARDIADAMSRMSELDRVLELVVKRGRALIDARTVLMGLRDGAELSVVASAGHATGARGRRLTVASSALGHAIEAGRAERIGDVAAHLRIAPAELGVPEARTALLVPLLHRGEALGVLAAFDRGAERAPFTPSDEQLLRTFAASAANAVALNRSVAAETLRNTIAAAEAERHRWARELHDQTLQTLGGLRVALSSSLARGDEAAKDRAIARAIEDIEYEIANLRGIISDLRPSMLDDFGLGPAIEDLLERRRDGGLEVIAELDVPGHSEDAPELDRDLETTIYRVIQEALTNALRHAGGAPTRVLVAFVDGRLDLEVRNARGQAAAAAEGAGRGIVGMRQRVAVYGGELEAGPLPEGGFAVRARLPLGEEGRT